MLKDTIAREQKRIGETVSHMPESQIPLYLGSGKTSVTQTIKAMDRPKDVIDHDANVIRPALSMWPKVITDWVLFDRIEDVEGTLIAYPIGAAMEADTGFLFFDTSDKYPFSLSQAQVKKILKWAKAGDGFILGINDKTEVKVIRHSIPKDYDTSRKTLNQMKGVSMVIPKGDLNMLKNERTKPAKLSRLIGRHLLTEDQSDILTGYDITIFAIAENDYEVSPEAAPGLKVIFEDWNRQIGAERFKLT